MLDLCTSVKKKDFGAVVSSGRMALASRLSSLAPDLARRAARALAQRTGRPAQITHHEVEAVIHLAEGDEAGALELVAAAAAMEDANAGSPRSG